MAAQHSVLFQPAGIRGSVLDGTTILEASRRLGVGIESACGEEHTCGKCRVRVESGPLDRSGAASSPGHLSPFGDVERRFVNDAGREAGYRLACVAEIHGDVLVFVPEESRTGAQVVLKAATDRRIEVKPAVVAHHIELAEPTLADTRSDLQRLCDALERSCGLRDLSIDHAALKALPNALREGGWRVTVTVRHGREIVRVDPGAAERLVGLAVDVGTTTVAGYLCDLRTGAVLGTYSMMNPQLTYGEDVMSRITYAMTGDDGLRKLNDAVIGCLNTIARGVTEKVGLDPTDIVEMTLVGNTAMHHIVLNVDPVHLGRSPFTPAISHSFEVKARDLGIGIHPGAWVFVLPVEAAFVGADNVGVLIAEEPYERDSMTLIVDIGTNGELVLGDAKRLVSASCATGSALEGAHITFGMRAAPGAIERVRVDSRTKEPSWWVVGRAESSAEVERGELQARGICGSGIVDAIAELFRTGVILKSGVFDERLVGETPRVRRDAEGRIEYVLAWVDETSIGRDVTIGIEDVRAVQLAKAALYAGAKILMRTLGVRELDEVVLAGAFGSRIDKASAMVIGMFPDCDPENVRAVGNAAGDGARIALLNTDKRAEADARAREVEYVELTVEDDFQRQFMEAVQFPHMNDPFPHLADVLGSDRANVRGPMQEAERRPRATAATASSTRR